jgi:3',5'-cyclic AMP phosphodiesterase CpdA
VEQAVAALVDELDPELVVCSGDLTHRNRPEQHARAAAFLRRLGRPVLAVPGNHDMPMLPPARILRTFGAFCREWGDSEPVHRSELLHVVGLNSARGWLYQEGAIRAAQLRRVAEELAAAAPAALRVVVLHHHLCSAPWRTTKRPVFRRSHVITALEQAGADLVLSGHVHQSSVYVRSEFEAGESRTVVIVNAPGLGRPRAHRHGEAAGLHVYLPEPDGLRVLTYAYAGSLERVADRLFPSGRSPGTVAPSQ